ncbi:hypothetical protein B0H13DRAFT_61957 [Mycena leptocephala]|nr:hypothetical protein B0H13DRAFT_61957 [Mycena leptocephala]
MSALLLALRRAQNQAIQPEDAVYDSRLANYFAASAFTILIIDFFSTINEEINFVWKKPWSVPSGLYVQSIYDSVYCHSLDAVHVQGGYKRSRMWFHSGLDSPLTTMDILQTCRSFIITQNLASTLLFGTFDLLLMLRSVSKPRRSFTPFMSNTELDIIRQVAPDGYILFSMLFVEMISMIVILLLPETYLHDFIHLGPVLAGCYFSAPVMTGKQFAFYAVPPLLVTFAMFILTIHKCVATLRRDKLADLPIINLFLRDGIVWFIVVFFFYGSEMIIWATARATLTQVLVIPSLALFSLISSRILLETRSLSQSNSADAEDEDEEEYERLVAPGRAPDGLADFEIIRGRVCVRSRVYLYILVFFFCTPAAFIPQDQFSSRGARDSLAFREGLISNVVGPRRIICWSSL